MPVVLDGRCFSSASSRELSALLAVGAAVKELHLSIMLHIKTRPGQISRAFSEDQADFWYLSKVYVSSVSSGSTPNGDTLKPTHRAYSHATTGCPSALWRFLGVQSEGLPLDDLAHMCLTLKLNPASVRE